MTKYLVNYAHGRFLLSQKRNSETGLSIGGFDQAIEYGVKDLDIEFVTKNKSILQNTKGAGYWLWKPYIIQKTLQEVPDGDVVMYSDAGVEFINSVNPLISICLEEEVVCFAIDPHDTGNPDIRQIKRDALILTGCDTPEYIHTNARLASFCLFKKTPKSLSLAKEWLTFCENEHILTDLPNEYGVNYPEFIVHRHDQSVFSLMTKKYGIAAYRDPSQWGNPFIGKIQGTYPQLLNHTRIPL